LLAETELARLGKNTQSAQSAAGLVATFDEATGRERHPLGAEQRG
jgi:hypothetical protein